MAAGSSAPSELLSGPDLGAGFLHQLSIDRFGEATTFTHHAQDGGDDAGGPPIGPLDVLGFVHPSSPCMFGGPRCWHRRYLLPFEATSRVRAAYQRHRFVLEPMLRQARGEAPVDLEGGLRELLLRVAEPLRAEGVPWYVAGSASVALAGGGGTPRDLDLGTSRPGVDRLAELLREFLVEPLAPTDWPPGRSVVGARAFLGAPRAGLRLEWAVPIEPRPPLPWEEFSGVPGVPRTATVAFAGAQVTVSRPEYAVVRAAERGAPAALEHAVVATRRLGPDAELLDTLLGRSHLAPSARSDVRARVLGGAGRDGASGASAENEPS